MFLIFHRNWIKIIHGKCNGERPHFKILKHGTLATYPAISRVVGGIKKCNDVGSCLDTIDSYASTDVKNEKGKKKNMQNKMQTNFRIGEKEKNKN